MKTLSQFICYFLLLMSLACETPATSPFDQFFTNATLRIDYFHEGDAESEEVTLDETYYYSDWAGSMVNLVDSLNYGAYYHKVYDLASGQLIYSRGFDSYFKEYQVSTPALEGEVKEFHESAIVPMPRNQIVFALDKRAKTGELEEIFRIEIDPNQADSIATDPEVRVFTSLENGDPHTHADIAIIGDG